MKDHTTAISQQPGEASYYSNRGDDYYSLKQYEEALADYSKAIELKPTAVYYTDRASTYYFGFIENEKALADIDAALKLDPGYQRALQLRSQISSDPARVEMTRL